MSTSGPTVDVDTGIVARLTVGLIRRVPLDADERVHSKALRIATLRLLGALGSGTSMDVPGCISPSTDTDGTMRLAIRWINASDAGRSHGLLATMLA